tara:strand:+ start:453 stop:929 length:477 start_codon:yes stop_codon:yes gene_type:complete
MGKAKNKEHHEEIIMTFRRSRKAFIIEYLCAFTLISLFFIAILKGYTIRPLIYVTIFSLVGIAVISAELSRYLHRCKVSESKILIVNGLIKQSKRHIFITAITDIDAKQGYLQRIFGYGDIDIKSASGEKALVIKDINNPEGTMKRLEELIENYKNKE